MKVKLILGLAPIIDEKHQRKMMRNNLLRIVTVFAVTIFVWTSQSRIKRYRRTHDRSYFSAFRQNIATINQTIYYAYWKCFYNFHKSCEFMSVELTENLDSLPMIFLFIDVIGAIVGK